MVARWHGSVKRAVLSGHVISAYKGLDVPLIEDEDEGERELMRRTRREEKRKG
ncbi:MAG: hypothetical protein ACUVUE_05480 [Candidatus Bathycorpusculaceae bacterium]